MRKVEGKEVKFFNSEIQIKEEERTLHSEGFICTTHPDRAKNKDLGTVGDILSETVIDKIVTTLNDPKGMGHPEAVQVSYRHDWLKQENPDLPAAGINTTAEKRQTQDGQWGVYVDTEHTTTFPEKDTLKYEIEKKIIPGYSIEYDAGDNFEIVEHNGEPYRFIKDLKAFHGYGFANGRKIGNPNAEIVALGYKEMVSSLKSNQKTNEVKKMETKEDAPEEQEKATEEVEEKKDAPEAKPEEKDTAKEDAEIKEFKEYQSFKKRKSVADEKIKIELKEKRDLADKPMIPAKKKIDTKEIEIKEAISYKEAVFGETKSDMNVQWKEAGKLHTALAKKGLIKPTTFDGYEHTGNTPISIKMKEVEIKNGWGDALTRRTSQIEYKASLTTDSNYSGAQTTYWDALDNYEQTPAEMNHIYSPVIISAGVCS